MQNTHKLLQSFSVLPFAPARLVYNDKVVDDSRTKDSEKSLEEQFETKFAKMVEDITPLLLYGARCNQAGSDGRKLPSRPEGMDLRLWKKLRDFPEYLNIAHIRNIFNSEPENEVILARVWIGMLPAEFISPEWPSMLNVLEAKGKVNREKSELGKIQAELQKKQSKLNLAESDLALTRRKLLTAEIRKDVAGVSPVNHFFVKHPAKEG